MGQGIENRRRPWSILCFVDIHHAYLVQQNDITYAKSYAEICAETLYMTRESLDL